MERSSNVFDKIIAKDLCSYCGLCISICPTKALELNHDNPVFHEELCINCSLCLKVCPKANDVFSVRNVPSKVYIGRTLLTDLKRHAHSGGVVMTLTLLALELGLVDSVITTACDSEMPQRAVPYVLRNPDKVTKIGGSRYCYCPLLSCLKDVCASSKSICIVGLPCQLNAVKLACEVLKELDSKLKLLIGLLCFNNFTYTSLKEDILSRTFNVNPANVRRVNIERGVLEVELSDGSVKKRPVKEFYKLLRRACSKCRYFIPPVCDLAVGSSGAPKGYSVILVYSKLGEELLHRAANDGLMELTTADEKTLKTLKKLVRIKARRI